MIVLDTHPLAWLAAEPGRLSRTAASAIRRARNSDGIAISDITLWELAFLFWRGALRSSGTIENAVREFVEETKVTVLPITPGIAALAMQLPADYPRDPSDRLIGATALAHGLVLVTRDERIRASSVVKTLW